MRTEKEALVAREKYLVDEAFKAGMDFAVAAVGQFGAGHTYSDEYLNDLIEALYKRLDVRQGDE